MDSDSFIHRTGKHKHSKALVLCETKRNEIFRLAKYQFPGPICTLRNISFGKVPIPRANLYFAKYFVWQSTHSQGQFVLCEIFRFAKYSNSLGQFVLCEIFRFAKYQFPGPICTLRNILFRKVPIPRANLYFAKYFVSQSTRISRANFYFAKYFVSQSTIPRANLVLCEITGFNTRDFNRLNKIILTSAVVYCLVLK